MSKSGVQTGFNVSSVSSVQQHAWHSVLSMVGHFRYLRNRHTLLPPHCRCKMRQINLSAPLRIVIFTSRGIHRGWMPSASSETIKFEPLCPHLLSLPGSLPVLREACSQQAKSLPIQHSAHKQSVLMAALCQQELTSASESICTRPANSFMQQWRVERKMVNSA